MDRVPGQPLSLVDPNSRVYPTKQLVLNPEAWSNPRMARSEHPRLTTTTSAGSANPPETMALAPLSRSQPHSGQLVRTSFCRCALNSC